MGLKKSVGARGRDFLWVILFLIIFVNGFESGGYQASLWSIGQDFDLTITSMGLFAAAELLADMLAPLLLGGWADKVGKAKSMTIMLCIQLVSSVAVLLAPTRELFVGGMFIMGLTTSALQFISIAALADAYPVSGERRIGYITSMYAFGAVVSPLVVSFYLGIGWSWKTLFVFLGLGTLAALIGLYFSGAEPREKVPKSRAAKSGASTFIVAGILLLCVVMAIYVGFENGFAFFVDTLFTEVLHSDTGKLALSLYWFTMIPARIIAGRFAKYAEKILLGAVIALPIVAILVSIASSGPVVMALCIPLGIASGVVYPSVLTIMLPFAGKKTATATGMITTATGIGGFSFTALTGFVADRWGMQAALMVLAAFFVISIVTVLRVRAMRRNMGIA